MTKILIIDDHPLYREGLMGALSGPPLRSLVVGADSIAAALTLLDSDPTVELALIDFKLKNESGLDALKQIGAKQPTVARMLISGEETADVVQSAMRAGAQGFLAKSLSITEMLQAIRQVLDGGVYWEVNPSGGRTTADAKPGVEALTRAVTNGTAKPSAANVLTLRQLEALQLLGAGHSNAQIAAQLGITERTAKAHVAGIFEAFGVDTRLRALVRASELGLIRRS
jgi:DNA-binding NarL/FixJ family response regulator